jgi:hypothetical protein
MTGYMQLDRAITMAAEREARAAAYRKSHRPRPSRAERVQRVQRESRSHRLSHGFAAILGR